MLGRSQVVRQRFLVPCTVGSNPTAPATMAVMEPNLNENAIKLCETISNEMTPEQITEAEERARVCIESGYKNCG